jgi:hypothetical protein
MYKYFTKYSTYHYLDVINKLLASYKYSVHYTVGMPPSKVNPSNIYFVWRKVNSPRTTIPESRVKFKVGDLVTVTKEKVKFAKGYKQTFSTEIFPVFKIIQRVPQPVCELSDLKDQHI